MTNPGATSEVSSQSAAAAYKQTATLAASFAAALPAYAIVAEVLTRGAASGEPPAFFGPLRIALFVAAGVLIFMTTIVKGIMLRNTPAEPAARLARLRTTTIAGLAMAELPALSGLVLALLGRTRSDFYMLLAISAYMMVRHFPRRGAWEEYLRRGSTHAVR